MADTKDDLDHGLQVLQVHAPDRVHNKVATTLTIWSCEGAAAAAGAGWRTSQTQPPRSHCTAQDGTPHTQAKSNTQPTHIHNQHNTL